MATWHAFVAALAQEEIEFPQLKVAQLAQAILESGWGTSRLFTEHGNPFGMKYRKEMAGIARKVAYEAHDGLDDYCAFATPADAVRGYWVFIDRNVYAGWRRAADTAEDYLRYIAYAGYVGGRHDGSERSTRQKEAYITKLVTLFPKAQELLDAPEPETDTITPDMKALLTANVNEPEETEGLSVLLEIGHGPQPGEGYDPGAVNPAAGKTEHALNLIAAEAAQTALEASGVTVTLVDDPKGLVALGQMAQGYTVFCSVHHNAFNHTAQGAEVLVAPEHSSADASLAKAVSTAMAEALGIDDRGVKDHRNLGVLRGAKTTNVRAAILAECYFLDVPDLPYDKWSAKAGEAMGQAIAQWLGAPAA